MTAATTTGSGASAPSPMVEDPHRRRTLLDALNEWAGHDGHLDVSVVAGGDRLHISMTTREFGVLERVVEAASNWGEFGDSPTVCSECEAEVA